MLTFFRRIRQGLLTQNRFSKYMLYAIGEIVLVVIGILIALWINNLNVENQQRKERDALITDLKEELSENLAEFKERRSKLNETNKNLIKVLNFSADQEVTLPLDSIKPYVSRALTFSAPELKNSRLSSAKWSGSFDLLSEDLATSFTSYETAINNYRNFLDATIFTFSDEWTQLLIKFNALQEFHGYAYPGIELTAHPELTLAHQELYRYTTDPVTYQKLYKYYVSTMVEAAWLQTVMDRIEDTLSLIQEEQQ